MPTGFMRWIGSERPATLDQIDDQNDYSDNEQEMDESAPDVADKSEKPKNQQNYHYCPEHKIPSVG